MSRARLSCEFWADCEHCSLDDDERYCPDWKPNKEQVIAAAEAIRRQFRELDAMLAGYEEQAQEEESSIKIEVSQKQLNAWDALLSRTHAIIARPIVARHALIMPMNDVGSVMFQIRELLGDKEKEKSFTMLISEPGWRCPCGYVMWWRNEQCGNCGAKRCELKAGNFVRTYRR